MQGGRTLYNRFHCLALRTTVMVGSLSPSHAQRPVANVARVQAELEPVNVEFILLAARVWASRYAAMP
jgi:hypothetical protein